MRTSACMYICEHPTHLQIEKLENNLKECRRKIDEIDRCLRLRKNSAEEGYAVADLGGVRGVQMHPPLAASNVFCVHNCTSPSNDYAAVACSNNNQAQLHTYVSVPY